MKNLKVIFSVFLLVILVSCDKDDDKNVNVPCLPESLSSNVLVFYSFAEGTLNDISGNHHHLMNNTTAKPASDRNGNENSAYEFSNSATSSEFLTTSSTDFLNNLSEFSVSLWYQPKDTSRYEGNFECLINRDLSFACPDRMGQWSVGLYGCRRAVFGRTNSVWDDFISNNRNCKEEILARTDNWYHLVATFKQEGVEMAIYRNGVLEQTSTGNANCGSGEVTVQDIGDLFLGKDYTGKIDDVIIFNKTLSQEEVDILFNLGTCCEK